MAPLGGYDKSCYFPWHFLYFLPEPHGQGSFLPTLGTAEIEVPDDDWVVSPRLRTVTSTPEDVAGACCSIAGAGGEIAGSEAGAILPKVPAAICSSAPLICIALTGCPPRLALVEAGCSIANLRGCG